MHRASAPPTASRVALVVLALAVSGCERGCLSTWLSDRSPSPTVGGEDPRGSSQRDAAGAAFDLGGTDCSGGLARCVGGRVEISVAAHVRQGECPWETAGACDSGCLSEGLEVLAATDVAVAQLCVAREPLVRPVLAAEAAAAAICAEEGVSCSEAVVRVCAARGQPSRAVAGCVNGCARGVGLEPGDLETGDGPAAILCRRAHAERR